MVPEHIEKTMLSEYLTLLETDKINKKQYYHIDIPFSVKTEMNVLKEAGFKDVQLKKEYYSDTFNAAMIIPMK